MKTIHIDNFHRCRYIDIFGEITFSKNVTAYVFYQGNDVHAGQRHVLKNVTNDKHNS